MNGIAVSIRILSLVLYLFSFRYFTVVYFQLYEQHVKEENDEWGGEKQVLLFILFFHFYRSKKKEILKVREVLFFVTWKQFFSGKVFVIKLIPSKLSFKFDNF